MPAAFGLRQRSISAKAVCRALPVLLLVWGTASALQAQSSGPEHIVRTGLVQRALLWPASASVFRGILLPAVRSDFGGAGLPFSAGALSPVSSAAPGSAGFSLVKSLDARWADPFGASSPRDSTGTQLTLFGGGRSVRGGGFRHAGPGADDTSGFEVAAHYLRGEDWPFADPVEERLREESALLPLRDNHLERVGAEARYDLRRAGSGDGWVFEGGFDRLRGNRLTEVGAAHSNGWTRWFGRSRYRGGRLFAEALLHGLSAGDAAFYRTAREISGRSLLAGGRLGHSVRLQERQEFRYGVDARITRPFTNGTVTGVYEDADDILAGGGYLVSRTRLAGPLDLEVSLRADAHSRIEGVPLSPQAALDFRPAPGHTFRAGIGRFLSPPADEHYLLDLTAGRVNAGALIYDVRARGVPQGGFTFADRCPGGYRDLCMRSPLAPGEKLPADPSVLWNVLVEIAAATDPLALRPLRSFFLDPEPGELAPRLLLYNRKEAEAGRPPFLSAGVLGCPIDVREADPLQPAAFNTLDLQYRAGGVRGAVSARLWHSTVSNLTAPLRVETPTVFFDPTSLETFLEGRVERLVRIGIVPREMARFLVNDLTNLASQIPVGSVMPDQVTTPGILLTYRNYGPVKLWGADLALDIVLTPSLSLSGRYSHVSEGCVEFPSDGTESGGVGGDCSGRDDIALNLPGTRVDFAVRYLDEDAGVSAEARVTQVQSYPVNAGVYSGRVERYRGVDARLGVPVPKLERAGAAVTVTNLFNDRHREFVGAPEIGRLVWMELSYAFR